MDTTIKQRLDDAWLNKIDFTKIDMRNPFEVPERFADEPDKYLLWKMSQPDYFYFFVKYVLGVTMSPMQAVILKELWVRKFPMLMATRGGSKTTKGVFVSLEDRFSLIDNLFTDLDPFEQQLPIKEKVLGERGFHTPSYKWKKYPTKTIKMTTSMGFSIEGSPEHPVRVVSNGSIEWKELGKISLNDIIVIDRNPSKVWHEKDNGLKPDVGYLFGCLIGDGGYTVRGSISFTTADKEIIESLNKTTNNLWGKDFRKQNRDYAYLLCGVSIWDELFQKYGFNSPVCSEKDVPDSILAASKPTVISFIRGLFDTDGYVAKSRLRIGYCSKSKNLVKTLQFLLTRLGIISRIVTRRNKKHDRDYYYLTISGPAAKIFAKQIGFGIKRKQETLNKHLSKDSNTNIDIIPDELVLNNMLHLISKHKVVNVDKWKLEKHGITYETLYKCLSVWGGTEAVYSKEYQDLFSIFNNYYYYDKVNSLETGFSELYDFYFDENDHSYLSGGFISHNSFMLAVYAALRAQILKNRKIIVVGAAFRQSKVVFDYIEKMWINSKVWQSLARSEYKGSGPQKHADMWKFVLGSSEIIFLPLGDGEKIRGQRANDLLVDEFNTIDENIFEIKIMPFTSVSSDPIEKMRVQAKIDLAKDLNIELDPEELKSFSMDNQIVITGTPGYTFQHFYKYYNVWKRVICCRGNKERLREYGVDPGYSEMNHELFSIIRIPYNVIPKGIMDNDQIIRGKHTMHSGNFMSEFGAVFSDDSNGFFKRSLIEQATVSPKRIKEVQTLKGDIELFTARLYGSYEYRYVYGIDAASEKDNFSIVILECHGSHRRIVYSWVTRRDKHRALLDKKKINEENFYAYCARHIRNLMKKFPCKYMAIDRAGGGIQVMEALHDKDKMEDGEQMIWPVLTYTKDESGHKKTGLHIIHPIEFSDNTWVTTANHGMKKDLEEFALIFPYLDAVELANASYLGDEDLEESLEDVMLDINELKDEMSSIIHGVTPSGKERWDTPEEKTVEGKKARTRKDRYSALLMANAVSRIPDEDNPFFLKDYSHYGWAKHMKDEDKQESTTLYGENTWYKLPSDIYDV